MNLLNSARCRRGPPMGRKPDGRGACESIFGKPETEFAPFVLSFLVEKERDNGESDAEGGRP